MNKEQTLEAIKVMQAYVDGEDIEYLDQHGNWVPTHEPDWNWIDFLYLIKPKPVEFKVWYRDSDKDRITYTPDDDLKWFEYNNYRLITVREVV